MITETEDKTYNGWANYETWVVNMWLSNDQGIYEDTNDHMRLWIGDSVYTAGRTLKESVEELAEETYPGATTGASFVVDLFNGALSEVDWHEIVITWVEGMNDIAVDDGMIVEINK